MNEIFPTYKGLEIAIVSRTVDKELAEIRLDLWDVKEILENGFDCSRSKRKMNVEEKCIRVGDKIIKVVAELAESESGIKFWKLRHVGMFGYKKERFRDV
jgi:hypothetical protein